MLMAADFAKRRKQQLIDAAKRTLDFFCAMASCHEIDVHIPAAKKQNRDDQDCGMFFLIFKILMVFFPSPN